MATEKPLFCERFLRDVKSSFQDSTLYEPFKVTLLEIAQIRSSDLNNYTKISLEPIARTYIHYQKSAGALGPQYIDARNRTLRNCEAIERACKKQNVPKERLLTVVESIKARENGETPSSAASLAMMAEYDGVVNAQSIERSAA